jgi:hypothetical protein
MEEIKKQLHNFDHQIVNIEKELKTTLSMISTEVESSSQHNLAQNKGHYQQNEHQEHHDELKELKEQDGHHKHHKGHEHHPDHPNWAENLIHNVEEFSASIFEPNHEGQKEHHEHHEQHQQQEHSEHEQFEEKQHNSRVANRKKYNSQNIENIDQFSASTMDESQSSGISTGLTSINQKNYSELSSTFTNHNEEHHQNNNHGHNQGNDSSQKKTSEQLLETDFSDLSIDDWEDTTTNLSMSEWFEVDPNDKR